MQTGIGDRLAGGAGAAVVLAAFGWVFLGLAMETPRSRELPTLLLDFPLQSPPRPLAPAPVRHIRSKAPRPASPDGLRNKATDIAAISPLVIPVILPPVLAAPKTDVGFATNNGAADLAGPGEGAGGTGTGIGGAARTMGRTFCRRGGSAGG